VDLFIEKESRLIWQTKFCTKRWKPEWKSVQGWM